MEEKPFGGGGHSKALFQGLTSFFCKGLVIFTLWTILSLMQLLNSAHGVGVGEQKSLCSNETLKNKVEGWIWPRGPASYSLLVCFIS